MSKEIIPPEYLEHYKYLGALYYLGMHETMFMMKDGKNAYDIYERGYLNAWFF